jgi:hypothetical protein
MELSTLKEKPTNVGLGQLGVRNTSSLWVNITLSICELHLPLELSVLKERIMLEA